MAQKVIAIGASTGGVEALEVIFSKFPANIPPVVLVLHMPSGFTQILAARFDLKFPFTVKEARNGDEVKPGHVIIGQAGQHMRIVKKGLRYVVETFAGPKVQWSIPSVDVLFESVAEQCKGEAVGVILTGMGGDGARGLLKMREAGAATIGQDEKTCTIYGMPKVAMDMGAVTHQLPLDKIASNILTLAK
ncbi:MAG: CheB methylesterase domain-containing protein [Defluviitaleaceae bacterium]|nr:CheB methylesterase domain-containing protein [Defluviitaleaceae bacterium]